MKILVISYAFAPNVGGLERVAELINEGLASRGHDIQVITHQLGDSDHPYPVWRRPSASDQRRLAKWSDVILMHNMSATYASLVMRSIKKVVCVSHGDYGFVDRSFRGMVLRFLLRRVECYAVSHYVASRLPKKAEVLYNPSAPVEKDTVVPIKVRKDDILFVGRLVRGKGAHVLIEAIHRWPHEDRPSLTIVGSGDEEHELREMATRLELTTVRFTGKLSPSEVVKELARHRITAVPSVDSEGLPMVALEALASGSVIVASQIGGLPEIATPGGYLLPPGDADAWAHGLHQILSNQDELQRIQDNAAEILRPYHLDQVLDRYENALKARSASA